MANIQRRGFLAAGLATATATATGTGLAQPANAAQERPFEGGRSRRPISKPNILVILGDDLGWADLSSYGAPEIRTPNLDRLARSGIRFTDGYSGSSVCSPTRFSLYTGRYPGRLEGGLQEPIGEATETNGIPLDHPTLATLLKGAGYETALFGKWHCGYLPWFSPTRLGWDTFFGNFAGAIDYFSKLNNNGDHDLYEGEVEVDELGYYTHLVTDRVVDFIGQHRKQPWLINLNYTTPHWPWEGPEDRAVSDEITARIKEGSGGRSPLFHTDGGSLEVYRTMVEDLDDNVGRVLQALRRSGQLGNTVILFASDNGGERFSNVWPFTDQKGGLGEGGIRVPTLLSWPDALPSGRVSDAPVVTPDWTATLLEIAGAAPDPAYPLDGVSLAGYLLRGERYPEHDLFFRMNGQRALRRGDLKYLQVDGQDHLFDLGADVREQAELAQRRPDDLAELRAAWEAVDDTLLAYA